MAMVIEEVDVETVETRPSEPAPADRRERPRLPDMDRIRFELRRDKGRLERLWAD